MARESLVLTCQCGQVRCEGAGAPIVATVCYCDDCQAAGHALEALDHAPRVLEPDGGTALMVFRDDRFACTSGADLLEPHRLKPDSPTARMVARCCNTPVYLKFNPGFWTSAYRRRFDGDPPQLDMLTQTRHRHSTLPLPQGVPAYRGFGPRLFVRIIAARIAMLLGR